MRTNVDRRFGVLDNVDPTDLRPEIERRMAEPAPRPIPAGPSPWRRVAAVAVAVTVFAAAAAFAWEVFERAHREEPATTPDPWSWAPERWTELPLPPEVRDNAALVWTGKELVYWGGWPRGSDIEQAKRMGSPSIPRRARGGRCPRRRSRAAVRTPVVMSVEARRPFGRAPRSSSGTSRPPMGRRRRRSRSIPRAASGAGSMTPPTGRLAAWPGRGPGGS